MGWVCAALLALALAALAVRYRRFYAHHEHLGHLLRDIAEGNERPSFLFHDSPFFMRMSLDLEQISEQQKTLKAQIAREEFSLRTILSSMREGVMVVDQQHVIQLVNDALLALFGLGKPPLGKTVLEALRDPAFEEIVGETLSSQEPQTRQLETVQPTQSDGSLYLGISAVPVRSIQAALDGAVIVFHDMSRLRQLEEVRREFVANVSHELRTPLSIFHGHLENLLEDPKVGEEELVHSLRVMQRHSDRLNRLVDDLLTLARLESRTVELTLAPIVFRELVQQLLDDWKLKFAGKEINITTEIDPAFPALIADRRRIEQVLTNLLENALKFTPPGGLITIRGSVTDSHVNIAVADTGAGIAPSDLPHIFARFYRVDKARSRDSGGTGLGLSIVKHIIALHGGTVDAESISGQGTTITVSLPRHP